MDKKKEVSTKSTKDDLLDFICKELVPTTATVLKSEKEDWIDRISRAAQTSRRDGIAKAIIGEIKQMRDDGKIPNEYLSTPQAQECLGELFDALANDAPDEKYLIALKKIFAKAASKENMDEWLSERPQQLMRICRKLNGDELTILSACFHYRKRMKMTGNDDYPEISSAEQWPNAVAKDSNNALTPGIVDHYEENLINMKLIGGRNHADRSEIQRSQDFRLTPLGIELCEFIDEPSTLP